MTRCDVCGQIATTCTCEFIEACYTDPPVTGGYCVEVEGNGNLSTPIQFHSSLTPQPRPFVYVETVTSGQSITSGTAVIFDTEPTGIASGGMFSLGSPTRVTCQVDGIYMIGAKIAVQYVAASATCDLNLRRNGVSTDGLDTNKIRGTSSVTNDTIEVTLMTLIELTQGEYFEVVVDNISGTNTLIATFGAPHAYAWAHWVGFNAP